MKRFVILGLVVMLAAAAAYATETRVKTMGENNNIMIDDANVWLYPGRTFDYPNIGTGEFSDGEFNKFGFTWKFGEKKPWVLGLYFSTGSALQPTAYGDYPIQFGTTYNFTEDVVTVDGVDLYPGEGYGMQLPDNRRMDLLYGRKIGGVNFGFHFGYVSSSWKNGGVNDKSEEGFSVYDLSAGLTAPAGNWDMTVRYAKGSWTDRNADLKDESEPDGYSDFGVRARMFHKLNQTMTLVPHGELAFGTHGQKQYYGIIDDGEDGWVYGQDTTMYKSKKTLLDAGCGVHYMPVTNILAVLDFGLQFNKIKNEDTYDMDSAAIVVTNTKTMLPYWKIGLEGEVFSWLDVRFGAISNWQSTKIESDYSNASIKWNEAANQTYLGFGFNWNRLHVDAQTDPNLFLKGFNFVSGETTNMNMQLSVLYEMF